jgi:hypothetical protein
VSEPLIVPSFWPPSFPLPPLVDSLPTQPAKSAEEYSTTGAARTHNVFDVTMKCSSEGLGLPETSPR